MQRSWGQRLTAGLRRLVVLSVLALAACESPPVPDEPEPAQVLGAPVLVATQDGDRLFVLSEQSLRRTEKRNRPSGRLMVDGSVHYSVRRHELWALDPATLAVLWRRRLQEHRPTAASVAPRLTGRSADAIWWQGIGAGALATSDGRDLPGAGAAPPGSAPADAVNADWYFHTGVANGDGGPLRLPGTDAPLRARDPDGHFQLRLASGKGPGPAMPRLERRVDGDPRPRWTASLPLARLHGLTASERSLVFFGMADAGKVPGTEHEAQGSHVLVAVDVATGRTTALDLGQASLVAPPAH